MNKCKKNKSPNEFISNETNIAGDKTIEDWYDLVHNKKVEEIDWCKAFKFFEIRIKTRYLDPIKRIQKMNRNIGEGFAMVNLQCSLIETIESFYNGWVYQHEKEEAIVDGKTIQKKKGYYYCKVEGDPKINFYNQNIFVDFFKSRSPFKTKIIDGESFYKDVRCTLLHETQTKNGWIIRKKNSDENKFYEVEGQTKIIYRNNFQYALKKVIERYKKEITTGEGLEKNELKDLRENFLAKFNRICEISLP